MSSDSSASGDDTVPDSATPPSLEGAVNLSELFECEKLSTCYPFFYDVRPSLFEHCSWRASCAGDVLDRRLAASRSMRTRDVELVTNTLIFCFCRSIIKIVLIGVGIYLLLSCFLSAKVLLSGFFPRAQFSSVRLSQSYVSGNLSALHLDSFELHKDCEDVSNYSTDFFSDRALSVLGFTVHLE